MEPPFLVQRDGKKILATVPFALLCQLQRQARRLMRQALISGDPASKYQVEQIFAALQPSDSRAYIMMLVMEDACSEVEEERRAMQAAQAQRAEAERQSQAQQQVAGKPAEGAPGSKGGAPPARPQSEEEKYFCVHGCPVGVPCEMCEALAAKQARAGKAA